MNLRPVILSTLAAAALLAARPAAASTALGLGADYLVDPEAGAFQATLAVDTRLARGVSVGGRFGAMIITEQERIGIPLDLRLRLHLGSVYLDGLMGPWIVLDDDDELRFHGAVGFGVSGRSLAVGVEVGVLDSTEMVGFRLAFPF